MLSQKHSVLLSINFLAYAPCAFAANSWHAIEDNGLLVY